MSRTGLAVKKTQSLGKHKNNIASGSPTNDSLESPEDFVSPIFDQFSEKLSFSTIS
jgi:hypothetical protein